MNIRIPSRWPLKIISLKFTTLQTLVQFGAFTTHRVQRGDEVKCLNNALRVLDLASPKPALVKDPKIYPQFIGDLLQANSKQFNEGKLSSANSIASESISLSSHDIKPSYFSFDDDPGHPALTVFELHRRGLRIDCAVISSALSACGFSGKLYCGLQLQCLAFKKGFLWDVYVGTSLISMYSKCGDLCSSRMVFEEMPVKNIVSWTALISGFAQDCQIDVCLELYSRMRKSSLNPNDYTLTTLFSVCLSNGSLRLGKIAHGQAIVLGFDLYIHVANSLISMYCKCGNVGDAFCVFERMHDKDIVSWNSMITGYALHGQAWTAIDLFEKMKMQKMKPDGISFLGVLSSCRHVGLVDLGQIYFNSMTENGVEPDLGHYSCIVDLLGRAGLVEEGRDFILGMPIQPNAIIWGSLLSSCRLHDNVWIGIEAAENKLALEPSCAATHLQLAKLYAKVGLQDQVAKVLKMLTDKELRVEPGYSWIEIGTEVHKFRADDTSNSRMNDVLWMLQILMDQLTLVNGPEIDEELDDELYGLV